MRPFWLSVVCILCAITSSSVAAESEFQRINLGAPEAAVLAVAVSARAPTQVYAATGRAVYGSSDAGRTWRALFTLPPHTAATSMAVNDTEPPVLLLATDDGLYRSADGGRRWLRALRGPGEGERRSTFVAFRPGHPNTALVGTKGGLFLSDDGGQQWRELGIPPAAKDVIHAAFDPSDLDRLYLVSRQGLFAGSLTQGNWQQLKGSLQASTDDATMEEDAELGTAQDALEQPQETFRAIAVDPQHSERLYAVGPQGLLQSEDRGITWQPLPSAGVLAPEVTRMVAQAHSPVVLYVGTGRGVAQYDSQRSQWQTIGTGLASAQVNDLALAGDSVWIATEQGLYRYLGEPPMFSEGAPPAPQDLLANFVHEPTITQVQDVAIRYAEVHPDKIRHWRRQAALQALLPHLNFGINHDNSQNIHVDEGSFPNFQILETSDRKAGVDVTVTWDLGELIWNDDQTSIDVRSKLMAQLRDDIVDEVTRTYFERRRLQVLLMTAPPTEERILMEKELRVQELTALLDGLTGGYFSRSMAIITN